MSRKFIQSLKGLKDGIKIDLTEKRQEMVEEGYSSMKSSISDIEIPEPQKKIEEKVVKPLRSKKSVADQALQMYGNITSSNGGNSGKQTETGPNGGDLGKYSPTNENGGNTGTPGSDNYAALTTSMSMEEYEVYIKNKFGMNEDDLYVEEEEEQELLTENPIVTELEKRLLKLEDHSWIAIDKVMRQLAKEEEITPKELNKMFREEHDGEIPDDWVKKNQVVEQCGWIPLDEAVRITTTGQTFEVTFMFRCQYKRWKFFWPEVGYPTPEQMQRCVDMVYPNGKLISYYPVKCNDNSLIFVPPMTSNFVVLAKEDWLQMSDDDQETMELITEEYGSATSAPCLMEDGSYQMMIGEDAVRFGGDLEHLEYEVLEEGAAWTKSSGKNKAGGLNEKGRKSYERENPGSDLKAPSKEKGNPRRKSFCARMSGMKKKLTSSKTANDPDSRINKSLRAWNC